MEHERETVTRERERFRFRSLAVDGTTLSIFGSRRQAPRAVRRRRSLVVVRCRRRRRSHARAGRDVHADSARGDGRATVE